MHEHRLWKMDSGLSASLSAHVRAPVGWRIFDAPGRPGMTIENTTSAIS